MAKIDEHGFMSIPDRAKDIIKSGGEGISSVDWANVAMSMAGNGTAAAIGVKHPQWDEGPILVDAAPEWDEAPANEQNRAHLGSN